MKYAAFVVTEGPTPPEAIETMNREFPAYFEEMDHRGVRLFGRELDFPDKAVTVRVRGGGTVVTDGPFVETKEFVAGFDVLDCADIEEAMEVAAKSPVARFHPFEIRPWDRLQLGTAAEAFGQSDDSAGKPYQLTVWIEGTPATQLDEQAVIREYSSWQRELDARGIFVLGNALGGPETARTLRPRDGKTELSDGPFLDTYEFIAGIDVINCSGREQAIELAATHPIARYHAIEVRPFWSE